MMGALGRFLLIGAQISVETPNGHLCFKVGHGGTSRLLTGGSDAFFHDLVRYIDRSDRVDLAVAFVLENGFVMLESYLRDLLDRGGRVRMIVGDYLDVAEPAALRRLCDLPGQIDARVFETSGGTFHPKAWLFRTTDPNGAAIVGSSNLSRTALTTGVEWNLAVEGSNDVQMVADAFEELLLAPRIQPLTQDWVDAYAARRKRQPLPASAKAIIEDDVPLPSVEPHDIQIEALAALKRTRAESKRAGLVVLATGLGKTWLSAFDTLTSERVLFVAYRHEILTQTMATFRRIRPEARFGFYTG